LRNYLDNFELNHGKQARSALEKAFEEFVLSAIKDLSF